MSAPKPATLHLRPTADLAERVLLPGDPGRALALAQTLIAEPRMFNHHRGLWGYTGPARADGAPLTIQSTGMGGPSAAIVLSELIALGVRRAIRVGTCGALSPELELGELVIAREAICRDGASRALTVGMGGDGDAQPRATDANPGATADAKPQSTAETNKPQSTADTKPRATAGANPRATADAGLVAALTKAAPKAHVGAVVSVDLFYGPNGRPEGTNALAVEMETATLLAIGARMRTQVACVLAVSDTFEGNGPHPSRRKRIDDHALLNAAEAMGKAAVAALAA